MPAIVDYSIVLERMTAEGFRCNYHNGGAFGFVGTPLVRGWIGPPDGTIKKDLLPALRFVAAPHEVRLAQATVKIWQSAIGGPAWVMPMSHWHFELHDGSKDWMPGLLAVMNVDSKQLENRADGSAIEFAPGETAMLARFLETLLRYLRVSDFLMAFPGQKALCNVHHHKQLWWTTNDPALIEKLDAEVKAD